VALETSTRTPAQKGRLLAAICVALIATAWSLLGGYCEVAGVIVFGAMLIGLPLGLIGGTVVGNLAARCTERRFFIWIAAVYWTLLCDLAPLALIYDPDFRSLSRAGMVVSSLAIVIPAAIILERWTRPYEFVPRARTARS
jgi:hypothetical protein